MKVKNKYRYDYLALNLRAKVVVRFRAFSKKVAGTHSGTLTAMIDFFEWHSYSPHQRFAKDINAGVERNRKRIEAHIAISKSIEKAQNIPLSTMETMLKSLFEEDNKTYDPKAMVPEIPNPKNDKTQEEKTTVSRIKYDRAVRKLEQIKERLQYVLDQIEPVSNRFGKDFFKIDITPEEWARFKQMLNDS